MFSSSSQVMDNVKGTMQREVDDAEELMEPHFVLIKADPDFERTSEESVEEENFEATENPEGMDSSGHMMQSEVDDAEALVESLFVPVKSEPELEGISEEPAIDENFEAVQDPGDTVSREYAVKRKKDDEETLMSPLFIPIKCEPEFERTLEETVMEQRTEGSEITKGLSKKIHHKADTKCSTKSCILDIASSSTPSPSVGERAMNDQDCALLNSPCKRSVKTDVGEKPFKCSHCAKDFKTKDQLNRHMRTHTGEKPFNCPQCGKSFSDGSTCTRHMRIHVGEKPYKCKQCDKAFKSAGELKRHVRTHSGERPYECLPCAKSFSDQSSFARHMRIHTGENPYKCSVCGKTFKRNDELKVHMRSHTGETPFMCSLCGKAFKTRSDLTIHTRTHTGEMPFKCSLCQKAFKRSSHLSTHMRTHTGEKPYLCSLCGKAYTQSSSLSVHMRVHTGEHAMQDMQS